MPETTPSTPPRSQLQQEAAEWFSKMHGPNAEADRPAFEAWLARGALHLGAYNRAAEIWSMGKFLSEDERPPEAPATDAAPTSRRRPRRIALFVALVCVVIIMGARLTLSRRSSGLFDGAPEVAGSKSVQVDGPRQLTTQPGENRVYRLADGSSVTLRPDSLVTITFDAKERRLRLQRGQARFEVAHEFRAFIVAAGSGTVTARGTIFDVSIAPDRRVTVKLLRGSVEVAMPAASPSSAHSTQIVTHLSPGQHVDFADPPQQTVPAPAPTVAGEPAAQVELDGARLADLILESNRTSQIQIRLEDPQLGRLEAGGRGFPMHDPERLANRLARIFDLIVDHSNPAQIVLRRK